MVWVLGGAWLEMDMVNTVWGFRGLGGFRGFGCWGFRGFRVRICVATTLRMQPGVCNQPSSETIQGV